jgi:hypothetical protein
MMYLKYTKLILIASHENMPADVGAIPASVFEIRQIRVGLRY